MNRIVWCDRGLMHALFIVITPKWKQETNSNTTVHQLNADDSQNCAFPKTSEVLNSFSSQRVFMADYHFLSLS